MGQNLIGLWISGSVLAPVLVNSSINYLDDEEGCPVSKFNNDTKLWSSLFSFLSYLIINTYKNIKKLRFPPY